MPVLLNVFRPFAEDPAPYLGQELFFRIFQGHSIVQLSRFCLLLSCATTSIVYHSFSCLSTTFLIFFKFFLLPPFSRFFRAVELNNIMFFYICQRFFTYFFHFFIQVFHLKHFLRTKWAGPVHPCGVFCFIGRNFLYKD